MTRSSSEDSNIEQQAWLLSDVQARMKVAKFRDDGQNPIAVDSVEGFLDKLLEMEDISSRFPYGQDKAKECCDRLRHALIPNIKRDVPDGEQIHVPRSDKNARREGRRTKNVPPSGPGYAQMDAFDSMLAGCILFEIWSKWDSRTWFVRESDIWTQLQRLGRESIPRAKWEADLQTHLPNNIEIAGSEITNDGGHADNEKLDLQLVLGDSILQNFTSSVAQGTNKEVVDNCLHRMHKLAGIFPFGKDTVKSVLERLQANFIPSGLQYSSTAVKESIKKQYRRLLAELDNMANVRRARAQLDNMKSMVECVDFRLGKKLARWACERLESGISEQEDWVVFGPRSSSRNMQKDIFYNVEEGHKEFSGWVKQNALEWIKNEHDIWVKLFNLWITGEIKQTRSLGKSVEWVEDVIRCAETALTDLDRPEFNASDKLRLKAAESIHALVVDPLVDLSDDIQSQLRDNASSISPTPPVNITAKKLPFKSRSAQMRITTAHTLFSRWKHWDDLTWVIEEYAVWSEIHRVASTSQNWKGKRWSDKWAKEVHNLANKLREAEITADKKQRVAFSLRRLSQRTDFGDISTELVSTALRFGDSATLPSELLIAPQKLDLGPSEFVLGGSCTVRFGYYKIYGKREEVAIKEFDLTASTKIKLRIAQEAFTWRELSKTNRDFIVQFFGAEMSDKHLRLISQRMAHGDIVAFLNLETNKNETIRLKTISRVARAIAWMHSKDFIHGDIKGENVFVDAHGNPKVADFGISRLVHEAADADSQHVPTPRTYSLSLSQYANDESIQSAITNSSLRLRGSIRWMAPESFENPASGPTKKRDVYAFAYLVLEIFENHVPFHELKDPGVIGAQHIRNSILASDTLEGKPEAMDWYLTSVIPNALQNILLRCMRYDPALRPTASELEQQLLVQIPKRRVN